MAKISVGPFDLDVSVTGADIRVDMSIGFHGVSAHETLHLSLSHPGAKWNSPTVAYFSASLDLVVDEPTGYLTATAKFCQPSLSFPVHSQCEQASTKLRVLPAHGLGLLAAGVTGPGLDWLEKNVIPADMPTPDDLRALLRVVTPARLSALRELYGYASKLDSKHSLFAALMSSVRHVDTPTCQALAKVSEASWTELFRRAVADPVVLAAFPTVARGITFPPATATATATAVGAASAVGEPALDAPNAAGRVRAIAVDIAEIALAGATAVAVISGVVLAVLGIIATLTALPTAEMSLPPIGIAAIIVGAVTLVLLVPLLGFAFDAGVTIVVVDTFFDPKTSELRTAAPQAWLPSSAPVVSLAP